MRHVISRFPGHLREIEIKLLSKVVLRKTHVNVEDPNYEKHLTYTFNFIQKSNGEFIGQVTLDSLTDENVTILQFFVDEKFRGLGFGKAILQYMIVAFPNIRYVWTEVDNAVALNCYEACGFKQFAKGGTFVYLQRIR